MKRVVSILLAAMLMSLSAQFIEPRLLSVNADEPSPTEEMPMVEPESETRSDEDNDPEDIIILTEEMIAEQMESERRKYAGSSALMRLSTAAEVSYPITGTAGENLSWTLTEDGVFTINGTGAIPNYGYSGAPWYSHLSLVKEIDTNLRQEIFCFYLPT